VIIAGVTAAEAEAAGAADIAVGREAGDAAAGAGAEDAAPPPPPDEQAAIAAAATTNVVDRTKRL